MAKPTVIVINSHVARGSVGGRASVFALERLEYSVWSVPTVLLSWHPGHGPAVRQAIDPPAFAGMLADLAAAPALAEVGAVLCGYVGDAGQIDAVAHCIADIKHRMPTALFLCDPNFADDGGLFQPESIAAAIRERLISGADIATPNRQELAWLTGRASTDNAGLAADARTLPVAEVVVTSAFAGKGKIGNLVVTPAGTHLAVGPRLANVPHGTGDLFAALYLAARLGGHPVHAAADRATAAVLAVVRAAAERGADELPLAAAGRSFEDAMR